MNTSTGSGVARGGEAAVLRVARNDIKSALASSGNTTVRGARVTIIAGNVGVELAIRRAVVIEAALRSTHVGVGAVVNEARHRVVASIALRRRENGDAASGIGRARRDTARIRGGAGQGLGSATSRVVAAVNGTVVVSLAVDQGVQAVLRGGRNVAGTAGVGSASQTIVTVLGSEGATGRGRASIVGAVVVIIADNEGVVAS